MINPTVETDPSPTFFSVVTEANVLDHITFTIYRAEPPNTLVNTSTVSSGFAGAYDFTSSTLEDGNYVFEVTAVDKAGNVGIATHSFSFTVDTAGPDVSIAAAPTNPTSFTDSSPVFSYDVTADGSVAVTYNIYNATSPYALVTTGSLPASTGPNSFTWDTATAGQYIFQVRARDGAGNTSSAIHVFSYTSAP